MNGVTQKTHDLVQRWVGAKNAEKRCRRDLNTAECELRNAANELGKWLVPQGAEPGEKFNIWFGSGILAASTTKTNPPVYVVEWRKEPDGKDREEFGV